MPEPTVKASSGRSWAVRTHDWSREVDARHLDDIRSRATELAPGGLLHLVLEVLAYSDDEGSALGRPLTVPLTLGSGWIEIADDGRGTEIRVDDDGFVVRKPVMSTRDVRFFDHPEVQTLPDGHPRRGMSVVAALSPVLVHQNRRQEGGWSQAYHFGVPATTLDRLEEVAGTGTTVRFDASTTTIAGDQVLESAARFRNLRVRLTSAR